jgi:hypothetical protein
MKTYNITDDIYLKMIDRCYRAFTWDCIELADGCAVVFSCRDNRPYDVAVYDEDDNRLDHDFDIKRFETLAA